MSDKVKWPAIDAMRVADRLIAELSPHCERICFAGSLRRKKPEVSDVEIVYIPREEMRGDPDDIFQTPKPTNVTDLVIARLESEGVIARRKNVNGSEMFGEKNKLMVHVASGIPIDLFSTTVENWWVTLVVRTGSKETNLRLTNSAIARGGSLNAYGCGVRWRDGHVSTRRQDVIGCMIRPGSMPGSFTHQFGAAKTSHVRKRKDIYSDSREIREAANRALERRGLVNEPNGLRDGHGGFQKY